jgi:hypothetical protein
MPKNTIIRTQKEEKKVLINPKTKKKKRAQKRKHT